MTGPPPESRHRSDPARADLRALLRQIDGASYPAYRRLLGRHELGDFAIIVDRVPPDPYAGSARIRLIIERSRASLPAWLVAGAARRTGVEDYLARAATATLAGQSQRGGNAPPGSGRIFLEPCGPAILERSACRITDSTIELRLFVDLPAGGRRVRGLQAEELLLSTLPRLATATLVFSTRRVEEARRYADVAEDHASLREGLSQRGLVAFVGDGSVLARAGGEQFAPRRDGREVPFEAPESLAVRLGLPHAGQVRGMGIPAGVSLIVGGGFHGKSTLLDAVASGVHPHPPGDGRERVATVPEAVVIRAEDGRSVQRVDISAFLADLPSGEQAVDFSTVRASGSTSQAAAISEALEVGARLFLLDEDTCATNFMIRDGRMQRLVPRAGEPIVPFLDRVRELYERRGVSTLLVTGGSGDYLEVADTVILMNAYRAEDATRRAKEIVAATRSMRLHEMAPMMREPVRREPFLEGNAPSNGLRVGLRGPRGIRVGEETIDLAAVEQIAETAQVRALAVLLREAAASMGAGKDVEALVADLEAADLDRLDPPAAYDLARPRRFEIAAALNRWRSLRIRRPDR